MADNKTPVVQADTDISGKQNRKASQPKPMNYDQVLAQAGALNLNDKTELVKELKRQINSEVSDLQTSAAKATELTKGL